MLPVAEDPEPLKLFGHHADEALRVGAAGSSHVGERHLPLPRAELAIDLQLDRQPMAVVSRHVRRVEPRHGPRLHDEVLQDLVERGAEVNLAVRVRRTVVQNEARPCPHGPRGCVPYRSISLHQAIISGSAAWRLAFIGNVVRGRFRVSFQSAI